MSGENKYRDLVEQAEKAVAAVKDPSLKQIAFQKVLDDLLSNSDSSSSKTSSPSRTGSRKKADNLRGKARGGPTQYIQELIGDGFFKKPKIISQVKAELANRGNHIPIPVISMTLLRLCKSRVLRRQKLPGTADKNTYAYSMW